ncbi:hypothetical protein [Fortiea contorta]|uniref:hypothetical protein n=1 Tax=Fortiea contorta TaxID=1892405 RepID=UPI0012B610FE|nr:hypothetical protein [Fortiea contorta]
MNSYSDSATPPLRSEGYSLDKVWSILNAEGYTTSRGSLWTKQALNKRLVAA